MKTLLKLILTLKRKLVSLKRDFKNKLTYLNAGTSDRTVPKIISREDLKL